MLPGDLRFALEFRHDSWLVPPVLDALRSQRIALCIPDHPKMPKSFEITADFTYVRTHFPPHGIGYGKRALEPWAERVANWSGLGHDVFVYFNNDLEGHAVKDARTMKELLAAPAGAAHSSVAHWREGRDSNPGSGNTRSSA